jgi:hypothetical protein
MNAHTCQYCQCITLTFEKPSALKLKQPIYGFPTTLKNLDVARAGGCRLAELLLSRHCDKLISPKSFAIEWYPRRSRQLRFERSATLHLFAPTGSSTLLSNCQDAHSNGRLTLRREPHSSLGVDSTNAQYLQYARNISSNTFLVVRVLENP